MSDRSPPLVSVVMPMHNGARFLAATIESVLSQQFQDFELVISDDASTDASLALAESFDDSRIRILRNEKNLGFGGNWNRCLTEARGEFIKLLPQDDLLHPDCLSTQVAALQTDADPRLALVFCARQIIAPNGISVYRRGLGRSALTLSRREILRRTVTSGTNPIGEPGAVLFRRSSAQRAGRFDGTLPFVIDLDYWLRLLEFGDALYLPETLSSFRVSDQSHSVSLGSRQTREFSAFLENLGIAHGGPLPYRHVARGKIAARLQGIARMVFQRFAIALSGRSHP
jgi:glycosyltransferase involved in cell wall biosynthesis